MKQQKNLKPQLPRNTLLTISGIYVTLTKSEKKVADAVLKDPEKALLATVTDLAESANVGETTIIRFCRKLGFGGYQEFKLSVAQDLAQSPSRQQQEQPWSDDVLEIAEKITLKNELMLKDTSGLIQATELKQAVDRMLSADKIYIYGVGSSGITALDFHHRLMRIGMNVVVHTDSHAIAMSASLAKEGELAFGITTSGSSKDLIDPIKEAKANGATVICLTSHMKSPITAYADNVLLIPAKELPMEGGAFSTKISQIHLLDILHSLLKQKKANARDALERTARSVADKLY